MDERRKKESIFRKESIDRINSPDKLDDYLRVTRPGIYLLLIGVILLLASLLVWANFGTLPSVVETNGIAENGTITCFVSDRDSANIKVGQNVIITGYPDGEITSVSEHPQSEAELMRQFDDYSLYSLGIGEWNYRVELNCGDLADGIYRLKIVTGEDKPITFLFN